ncbi:hypothetical protein HYR54_07985 [Candidatus Acetothermia bacterium]|nr:hypothetical protein [Candidatus Acetothermia bacterium]
MKLFSLGMVAALVLTALWGFVTPTSAQTIETVRAEVDQLFVTVKLFNQALDQVGHDASSILKKCRFAKSAISRKKFHLGGVVSGAIDDALTEAGLLDTNVDALTNTGNDLDNLGDQLTQAETDVQAITIDPTRLSAILNRLMMIQTPYLDDIQTEVEKLQTKSSDLLDILTTALDDAQSSSMTAKDDTRSDLSDCIVLLRDFDRERRTIVIDKKSPIFRLLNEIRGLLRSTGPLPAEALTAVTPLDKTQRAHEVIALGRDVASIDVSLYSSDGRLLLTQSVVGNRLWLQGVDSSGRALANGVYLYVLTARGPDGSILNTGLKKFVVRH